MRNGNLYSALSSGLLALLLVCAPISTIYAKMVSGQVLQDDGQPAPKVRVFLVDTLHGAVTDGDGQFSLGEVPAGNYHLMATRPGMATVIRKLEVAEDNAPAIELHMNPNQRFERAASRYQPPPEPHRAEKSAYLKSISAGRQNGPNIVLILFDDLGFGDLGAYGNTLIRAPNIDSIAASGVKLTHFYSASPLCSPSRAALMTGRYPSRSLANHLVFAPLGSMQEKLLHAQGFPNHIAGDEILLPEILEAAGYTTALIGKWQLGEIDGYFPGDLGFDYFFGPLHSNNKPDFEIYRGRDVRYRAA